MPNEEEISDFEKPRRLFDSSGLDSVFGLMSSYIKTIPVSTKQ